MQVMILILLINKKINLTMSIFQKKVQADSPFKTNSAFGTTVFNANATTGAPRPKNRELYVTNRSSTTTKCLIADKDNRTWNVAELITTGLKTTINGISRPFALFQDLDLTDVSQIHDPNSDARKLHAQINSPNQIRANNDKRDYRFGVYFLDENNRFVVPTVNGAELTTCIEIPSINEGHPFVILDVMQHPDACIDLTKVKYIKTLTPTTSLAAISPYDIKN